jgi:gamma-glutamyltranspeptidase/glutathione hydrolase
MEQTQTVNIESSKELLVRWEASRRVLLPNFDPKRPQAWSAPLPGEIFEQPELLATLTKLVEAERAALKAGKDRKQAIMAAYERFYRGDIGRELVAATQAAGGLITLEDLDRWQVHVEDPAVTSYKGIDVYKLNHWVQGPVMLQTLNLLENVDVRSMGYNSARYIHTLYQAMNLAFAGRADQGIVVERLCARALRPDQLGAERSARASGRSVPVSRRDESVPRAARALESAHRRAAPLSCERRGCAAAADA